MKDEILDKQEKISYHYLPHVYQISKRMM